MIMHLATAILMLVTVSSGPGGPVYNPHFRNHPMSADAYAQHMAEMLNDAAQSHDIDPELLTALAFHESTFDPRKISRRTRAFGVLMVHPKYWGKPARRQCWDNPDWCDWFGVWYGAEALRFYLDKCKTPRLAIGAYRLHRCKAGPEANKVMRTWGMIRAIR